MTSQERREKYAKDNKRYVTDEHMGTLYVFDMSVDTQQGGRIVTLGSDTLAKEFLENAVKCLNDE